MKLDVFAVGCMAFMMFTGIPPFDEATRLDPKFKKTIYRGDLQGYLHAYGMPLLPPLVRRRDRGNMERQHGREPIPHACLHSASARRIFWLFLPRNPTLAWRRRLLVFSARIEMKPSDAPVFYPNIMRR